MALGLHNIERPAGATHRKKRVGFGPGSGHGKTATRGHKGQKSRSGYSRKRGFEGGQMPLHRRLPKRGFTNIFRREWSEVNLDALQKRFSGGAVVTPEVLREKGIIKSLDRGVVILGRGELKKSLKVTAHRFSASAKKKIETAGGVVTVVT